MIEATESDEELMQRFGRGDAAAFEQLYRRHELRVFRYLYRNVRNHAAANDLMQDVWFAVARSATRYEPTARFTTWLYTLAHNRMVDSFRTSHVHQSLDAVAPAAADADGTTLADCVEADRSVDPAAAAQSRDEARAIVTAVGQLPAEQREAFLLQAESDLSVEDIARITGTSFETAKSRLRYARTKLRQLLWEYA